MNDGLNRKERIRKDKSPTLGINLSKQVHL